MQGICGLVFLLILYPLPVHERVEHCEHILASRAISDRGKKAFETFHLVSCLVVSYSGFYNYKAALVSDLYWDKDNS